MLGLRFPCFCRLQVPDRLSSQSSCHVAPSVHPLTLKSFSCFKSLLQGRVQFLLSAHLIRSDPPRIISAHAPPPLKSTGFWSLFFFFWLHSVFIAVAAGAAFSSYGKRELLFTAVCELGAQALGTWASVVAAHGLSCSTACGISHDQGLNLCPLHWYLHLTSVCFMSTTKQWNEGPYAFWFSSELLTWDAFKWSTEFIGRKYSTC